MTFLKADAFAARTLPILDSIASTGNVEKLLNLINSCPPEGLRSLTLAAIARLSPEQGRSPGRENALDTMFQDLVEYHHGLDGNDLLNVLTGEFGVNLLLDRAGIEIERGLLSVGLVRYHLSKN